MPDPRIDTGGNLAFLLETPAGQVVQKLYRQRKGWLREEVRATLGAARGAKTSSRAEARRVTEAQQLRHWLERGFDVPRLIEPADAALAPGPYNLIEFVEGPVLLYALASQSGRSLDERRKLMAGYARSWHARHAAALDQDDPRLLQEHGTLEHVIVCAERFVTIDHEQAFRAGTRTLPLVAKEFASALRSLLKGTGPETFEDLLGALISGYDDEELLQSILAQFINHPSPLWRAVRRIDRIREQRRGADRGKFAALDRLASRLRQRSPRRS